MKKNLSRLVVAATMAACIASSVGCYPAYPPDYNSADTRDYQDAKGYSIPQEPAPQPPPARNGVDPGLVIAGAAAVGLLGYAIGSNRGHHHYSHCGPVYFGAAPFGYGGGYCGPGW